jgi:hypothetical protein
LIYFWTGSHELVWNYDLLCDECTLLK